MEGEARRTNVLNFGGLSDCKGNVHPNQWGIRLQKTYLYTDMNP